MDKAKLIDLLYEVLPYVQEGERGRASGEGLYDSVSLKLWEAIKTLEKWEGA